MAALHAPKQRLHRWGARAGAVCEVQSVSRAGPVATAQTGPRPAVWLAHRAAMPLAWLSAHNISRQCAAPRTVPLVTRAGAPALRDARPAHWGGGDYLDSDSPRLGRFRGDGCCRARCHALGPHSCDLQHFSSPSWAGTPGGHALARRHCNAQFAPARRPASSSETAPRRRSSSTSRCPYRPRRQCSI